MSDSNESTKSPNVVFSDQSIVATVAKSIDWKSLEQEHFAKTTALYQKYVESSRTLDANQDARAYALMDMERTELQGEFQRARVQIRADAMQRERQRRTALALEAVKNDAVKMLVFYRGKLYEAPSSTLQSPIVTRMLAGERASTESDRATFEWAMLTWTLVSPGVHDVSRFAKLFVGTA